MGPAQARCVDHGAVDCTGSEDAIFAEHHEAKTVVGVEEWWYTRVVFLVVLGLQLNWSVSGKSQTPKDGFKKIKSYQQPCDSESDEKAAQVRKGTRHVDREGHRGFLPVFLDRKRSAE